MTQAQLETPILFCVFNRPDPTRRVFDAIRQAKQDRLLIVGDGPRKDRVGESSKVDQVHEIVANVDWDCDVTTNFSQINLGCKRRMASGIEWGFEQAEELIILEDDCLPGLGFFDYCQKLLEHFRNDDRVMMISGDNFQPAPRTQNLSLIHI